jgi:hypothetical protein
LTELALYLALVYAATVAFGLVGASMSVLVRMLAEIAVVRRLLQRKPNASAGVPVGGRRPVAGHHDAGYCLSGVLRVAVHSFRAGRLFGGSGVDMATHGRQQADDST